MFTTRASPTAMVKGPMLSGENPFGLSALALNTMPAAWTDGVVSAAVNPRTMRSRSTAKEGGTRSVILGRLRVLCSLVEAEAEDEDFDARTAASDKENHGIKEQEALTPCM